MLFLRKFLKNKLGDEEIPQQDPSITTSASTTKHPISREETQYPVPLILRSEFNFLKYPFFDLTKASKRDKIEIREIIQTKDEKADILWKVLKNVEYGFPSAFDKKVHRAVEQIINQLPKPITNPIRLGSLRDLCRLMGVNPNSGKLGEKMLFLTLSILLVQRK
jgi:hypothetical protein